MKKLKKELTLNDYYQGIIAMFTIYSVKDISDYSKKHCPKLFEIYKYADIEIISELIAYRDRLRNYNGEKDPLINYVLGNLCLFSITEKCCELTYFRDVINKVYEENLQFHLLQMKLTSLEQLQAQILDKLTIYAEMIDNFETK